MGCKAASPVHCGQLVILVVKRLIATIPANLAVKAQKALVRLYMGMMTDSATKATPTAPKIVLNGMIIEVMACIFSSAADS